MRIILVAYLIGTMAGNSPAHAETIAYQYDAQGRVVRVVYSGAVNNGLSTSYTLDKAGNRVNVKTIGAAR
jgi:YD repeat-containing protein